MPPRRLSIIVRLRNYLLAGIVVAAPFFITIYFVWTVTSEIDALILPLIPAGLFADFYQNFPIPGFGLFLMICFLIMLGALTANFVGKGLLSWGERVLAQMPIVRSIYNTLKQIFQTLISHSRESFNQAALIEWPMRGCYAIAFVTAEAAGEIGKKLSFTNPNPNRHDIAELAQNVDAIDNPATDNANNIESFISVFMPTTPNPTSGFLIYVPRSRIKLLDMSVEKAAKLIISAGIINEETSSPDNS